MQLFILDRNPAAAVRMLADVHVRKMCLETAQILSSVIVNYGGFITDGMPKTYNRNHPVIKALDSPFKINYTVSYNLALHEEFFFRFEKKHKYYALTDIYREMLFDNENNIEDFSFCRNFKDCEITNPDIIGAYREYYCFKKSIICNWHYTKRKEPDFLFFCNILRINIEKKSF